MNTLHHEYHPEMIMINWYANMTIDMQTEFMIIGSRQRVNGTQDNVPVKLKGYIHAKSLGLHIDSHLTWSVHIEKVCTVRRYLQQ